MRNAPVLLDFYVSNLENINWPNTLKNKGYKRGVSQPYNKLFGSPTEISVNSFFILSEKNFFKILRIVLTINNLLWNGNLPWMVKVMLIKNLYF